MKGILFILALGLLSPNSMPQIKGVDYSEAIPIEKTEKRGGLPYNVLIELFPETEFYGYNYEMTPAGYKKCLDKTEELLILNGKNFKSERVIDEIGCFGQVNDIYDYIKMNHVLTNHKVKIRLAWYLTDEDILIMQCNDKGYMLMFGHLPPEMTVEKEYDRH